MNTETTNGSNGQAKLSISEQAEYERLEREEQELKNSAAARAHADEAGEDPDFKPGQKPKRGGAKARSKTNEVPEGTETADAENEDVPELTAGEEVRYEFTFTGKTPILVQGMSRDQVIKVLLRGHRDPPDKNKALLAKAIECLYTKEYPEGEIPQGARFITDDRGRKLVVGVKAQCIFATLKWGGKHVKFGPRSSITASNGASILPEILSLEDDFYPFFGTPEPETSKWNRKENPDGLDMVHEGGFQVDVQRGVMNMKTAVGIVRPRFDTWFLKIPVTVVLGGAITEKLVQEIARNAGGKIGLCAYRPAKGGTFGQFKVEMRRIAEAPAATA